LPLLRRLCRHQVALRPLLTPAFIATRTLATAASHSATARGAVLARFKSKAARASQALEQAARVGAMRDLRGLSLTLGLLSVSVPAWTAPLAEGSAIANDIATSCKEDRLKFCAGVQP